MKNFNNKRENIVLGVFSLLFIFLFFEIYKYFLANEYSDLFAHFNYAVSISKNEVEYPGNFLMYYLVSLPNQYHHTVVVFALLMALSIYGKFLISYWVLKKNLVEKNYLFPLLMAFLLLFVFSIPSLTIVKKCLYFGNFVPNVWHNSTIIFLTPFAIALFYNVFLVKKYKYQFFVSVFLILVNIAIKPSFIFVFVGLLGIISFYDLVKEKKITSDIKKYIFLWLCVSAL